MRDKKIMKKKLFIAVFAAAFAWLAFSGAAMAKQDIPEVDGTYDVPGHPNLLVKVFVHKAKPYFGKKSNALPACSDADSNAVVKSAGWKLPKETWNYYVNSASAPATSLKEGFGNITQLSFSEWKDGTDLPTTFQYVDETSKTTYALDSQNILTWGSAPSNALAVTYIWYNRRTKVAVETDTIMNIKYPWSWTLYSSDTCGALGAYDAQNILTHELGHWVGLNDYYTSAYINNTMYGYGSTGEIKKDTLTKGDIAGVNKIY